VATATTTITVIIVLDIAASSTTSRIVIRTSVVFTRHVIFCIIVIFTPTSRARARARAPRRARLAPTPTGVIHRPVLAAVVAVDVDVAGAHGMHASARATMARARHFLALAMRAGAAAGDAGDAERSVTPIVVVRGRPYRDLRARGDGARANAEADARARATSTARDSRQWRDDAAFRAIEDDGEGCDDARAVDARRSVGGDDDGCGKAGA